MNQFNIIKICTMFTQQEHANSIQVLWVPFFKGAAAAQAQEGREELTLCKELRLCGSRRAERSYSTVKVRRGGHEEIPLVQGKEQRLCFAGASIKEKPHVQCKRNPSKMVGVVRGHQRADTLQP